MSTYKHIDRYYKILMSCIITLYKHAYKKTHTTYERFHYYKTGNVN